jgi:transposase, IS30 family
MAKWNLYPQQVRDRCFDLICSGVSVTEAAARAGVSRDSLTIWWRNAGAMKLKAGKSEAGLADPGPADAPGGPGHCLNLDERMEIMCGLRQGLSQAKIGALISRDKSVISREVRRNRNDDGVYHAGLAHARAHARARRPKEFKLAANPVLCGYIAGQMDQGWSPKLISAVLAKDHAGDQMMQVSHETIYQCLYVQTRGQLRKDLYRQLSLKRPARLPHTGNRAAERRGKFNDALKISDRPAEADDRAVPGHWEGDLIIGAGNRSAIGTLVERTTRFTILLHLPGRHTAEDVAAAMIESMKDLPEHLRRTITWDRGVEIAAYEKIRMELNAPVYLCDPRSPWQRGTNENTNRLLRHWFEKGSDLSGHTAEDLKRVQDSLNRRPRPTLDLDTPAQRLNNLLLQNAA